MPTIAPATTNEDAVTLLLHDHEAVKRLFGQFEKAKDSAEQLRITQQVCMELTIHAQIEKQIFYPAVRAIPEMEAMILESLEEHRQAKELIAKLQVTPAGDQHLEPNMKVLMEDIEHHVKEEESDMFPKVKKAMDKSKLDQIGQSMAQLKASLKSKMAPSEQRVKEEVADPSHTARR